MYQCCLNKFLKKCVTASVNLWFRTCPALLVKKNAQCICYSIKCNNMYLINTHVLHADYVYLINSKFHIEIMYIINFCSVLLKL